MQLQSAYVEVHRTHLHYYRTGGGQEPLVMLHGITDDGACWSSVAAALAARYDIFMVDLRGHGRSDAPADGYTLTTLAADVAELTQTVGIQRPILLGHSLGAVTSLVLAGQFPRIPQALILVDPPPFWRPKAASAGNTATRQHLSDWIPSLDKKTRQELAAEVEARPWSDLDKETWVSAKQRVSPLVTRLIEPPDVRTLDFPCLLDEITCPTLLVLGDPGHGAICSDPDAAELKTLLPQLETARIPRGTHSIHRSQFALFMKSVDHFLARIEPEIHN